ncbi:hypothetical protein QQ008_07395 [Fulvivirgaceae bacterium BMA10]|uniref:Uncharacterized protein n=1 Tax=Splendidivirga corallicola TaxID=3051826 RepID=A0ABT8KLR9_9BACT|nr:hypothetical protein [Fulvivirgaceae bacterium BMA10]
MIIPRKNSVTIRGTGSGQIKFNYLIFDSVGQFNEFVDHESKSLSDHNFEILKGVNAGTLSKINNRSEWYGLPVPDSIDELDRHNSFLGIELLKQIKPKIERHLSDYLRYLESYIMPKPKVSYNDRGLGMFSFDRATMGLYQSGKIALGNPIEKTAAQINIELGRDKINTRIKKVYAFFEHKEKTYPSIRLFLMVGANADVQGSDLLYVGLACAELVEFLEIRGVAVEVNVLIGSAFHNQVCLASVRVKRFQDKTDKNLLLLLSSDPRYFRYRGFKALIALSNYFGLKIPNGLGRLKESMGKRFVSALDPKGFVFEQSYSLKSAAKEVKRIIDTYKTRLDDAKKG